MHFEILTWPHGLGRIEPKIKRILREHECASRVQTRRSWSASTTAVTPSALEVRKLYRRLADRKAGRLGLMRVVDESGEDYLDPTTFFLPISLSAAVRRAFRRRR